VTVANAEPEVKAVADEVIGSNDDDAVVKYMLQFS
jgi:hydroxymethylpyrimidine pyrophosphatase-like HAD family hydrolase